MLFYNQAQLKKTEVLSANSLVTEVNPSGRLLIDIKANMENGPKLELCGAPASIWDQFED